MKTYLLYGVVWSVAGAALLAVLYLLGLHSDPAKLTLAQVVGVCGGLGIAITCITLGIKARRAEIPATEDFGYGRALGGGVMVTLFAALFSIAPTYCYPRFINPEFVDVIVEAQKAKLEERKMSAAQMEGVEKMVRTMSAPGVQAVFGFIGGLFFGTVISLVAAAILKRPAVPEDFATPPPLA